jgi:flagellar hook-basal body complex protein FliE
MTVTPILAIGTVAVALQPPLLAAQPPSAVSFGQMIANGLQNMDQKVIAADKMVQAFALDDSVPIHQVMYALDQARSSMELAMQVRARLLDGYQQLMNMQL